MKDYLIKVCGQRGNPHAEEVCFTGFVQSQNISAAVKSTSNQQKHDPVNIAFSCVISLLKSDPGKLSNSVELYDVYSQSMKLLKDLIMVMRDITMLMLITHKCARSSLIQKLQEHFGDVSLFYIHKINGQLE